MSETPTAYQSAQVQHPARRPSGKNLSQRRRAQAQRRFLDELEVSANIAGACRAAQISRTIAYEWRAQDPAFAAAWQDALDAALDDLEEIAFRRAREGSDQLAIFLLKAHRPEKYRDVVNHEASGEVAIHVVFTNDWRGRHTHAGEAASSDASSDAGDELLDLVAGIVGVKSQRDGQRDGQRDADGVTITYRGQNDR